MKTVRRVVLCMLCVLVLTLGSLLASCQYLCTHTSFGEWVANGTADCNGQPEKRTCTFCGLEETRLNAEKPQHAFGEWAPTSVAAQEQRICATCGEIESRTLTACTVHTGSLVCERCLAELVSSPEIDFSSWDSIGIKVQDAELMIQDPAYPTVMSISLAEVYLTLDENNRLYGYGNGVLYTVRTAVDSVSAYEGTLLIEGGEVYFALEGEPPIVDQVAEAPVYVTMNFENLPAMAEIEAELQANEEMIAYVADLLPKAEAWLTDSLLPVLEGLSPGFDTTALERWYAKLLNPVWVRTAEGTGAVLTLDFDAYYAVFEKLAGMSILDLIDDILGEGKSEEWAEFLASDEFLALSVADALNFIEVDVGLDITELLASLDALAATVTGDETATLEMLLEQFDPALPFDDIDDLLEDEELLSFSIKDFILLAQCDFDENAADALTTTEVDEILAWYRDGVDEMFDDLGSITVFDGSSPNSPYLEDMLGELDEMLGTIDDMVSVKVHLDATGRMTSYVITGKAVENENVNEMASAILSGLRITVTPEGITVTLDSEISGDMQMDIGGTASLIPGMEVTANAAKVAALKANASAYPTLTVSMVEQLLSAEYGTQYLLIVRDNTVYALRYFGSSRTFDVYAFGTDAFGIIVQPACGDLARVAYTLSYGYGCASFPTVAPASINEAWVAENFDAILAACGPLVYEGDVETYYCLYDTETGEIEHYGNDEDLGLGHDFACTDYPPVDCESVGYEHYVCQSCGAAVYDYYTSGHDYEAIVSLLDEYSGALGGYLVEGVCTDCQSREVWGAICFNTDLPFEDGGSMECLVVLSLEVTEETAGLYRIRSQSQLNMDLTVYDYGNGYEVAYDRGYGEIYIDVPLYAGRTYLFVISGDYYAYGIDAWVTFEYIR